MTSEHDELLLTSSAHNNPDRERPIVRALLARDRGRDHRRTGAVRSHLADLRAVFRDVLLPHLLDRYDASDALWGLERISPAAVPLRHC